MPTNFNNTPLTNATTPNLSVSPFMTLDSLNTTRTSAVYQISVSPAQANVSVKAAIRGLTADMDLALVRDLNNNGIAENSEILKSSTAIGIVDKTLNLFNLTTGTYYLVVKLADGVGANGGNYTLQMGATTAVQQDLLWRNSMTGELGAWTFNGTTYQGSQSITKQFGTEWKLESGVLDDKGFADFNRDRTSDVVLRKATGDVKLLLLENNTVIDSPTIGTVGAQDVLLGMADFNRDGVTDLLWRNTGTNAVTLWQVTPGTTGFTTVNLTGLASPSQYEFQGLGDFNGDGNVDILWRSKPDAQSNYRLRMTLLNGTTLLQDSGPMLETLSTNWKVISLLDQNGDGKADIGFRQVQLAANNNLAVWTMNGLARSNYSFPDGNFLQENFSFSGGYGTGEGLARKTVTVWRNQSDGTLFLRSLDQANREDVHWVREAEASDLNLVSVQVLQRTVVEKQGLQNLSGAQTDIVWRNTTSGTIGYWRFKGAEYVGSQQIGASANQDWSIAGIGDFDGNGVEDFLWQNKVTNEYSTWSMGKGADPVGVFLTLNGNNVVVPQDWKVVGVEDVDRDGKADLIWQNLISNQLYLWTINGAQVQTYNLGIVAGGAWKVSAIGDFDGNGIMDLCLRDVTVGKTAFMSVQNHSLGALEANSLTGIGQDWVVEGVGDFDGDRKTDLFWRNSVSGQMVVWRMLGLSNPQWTMWAGNVGSIGQEWQVVGVEDMDGDGRSDILWRNVALNSPSKGQVAVWLTQLTDSGQLDYSFRQAVLFKNSDFMTAGIDQVKTSSRSIAIPTAATTIQINLVNDTGTIGDNVTNIPDLKISVGDSNAIAELLISLDGQNWQNVKSQLVNNALTIDRPKLESIFGRSLDEGRYTVSVRSKDNAGKLTNQSLLVDLDTLAPSLNVTGLQDGMTWESTDTFAGSLIDRDALSRLEYWVNDGIKTSIALNVTSGITGQSTLTFNNIALSQLETLPKMTEQKLYVKGVDRAGNVVQYDYSFMRLDLPGMTEDTDWSYSMGQADDRSGSGSTGGVLPSGVGGVYYIGAGGAWGYSSGSGGSGSWNPGSFGGDGTPPLPTQPGQDPNEQLTYLQALNVILNTAVDALSKHSSVVVKKTVLGNFKSDLLAMGKVIEFYGLHESFKTEFNELFSLGYDKTDDRVSWREAVSAGWTFAKSVALDSKPVRLKAFESQVFGMVRGMMVRENISLSSVQEQQLKQTLEAFSRRYAVLKPVEASSAGGEGSADEYGFQELLWSNRWSSRWLGPEPSIENGWLGYSSFKHLEKLIKGLTGQQVIDGFENAQVLIASATRTAPLWREGYQNVVAVRDGGFLRELIETGLELTRVGATNPAGLAAISSAWLEGVLEKNVQLVAGGLSQFIRGFEDRLGRPGYWDTHAYTKALDYGQRLMRAAAGVQDAGLRGQVMRSDTLSELVNLGGAYAALDPDSSTIQSSSQDPQDFLDTVWRQNNLQEATSEIQSFLDNFKQPNLPLEVFGLQRKVLQVLKQVPTIKDQLRDVNLNAAISVLSGHYAATYYPIGNYESEARGFFVNVWRSKTQQEVRSVSQEFQKLIQNESISIKTNQDVINILLKPIPIIPVIGRVVRSDAVIIGAGARPDLDIPKSPQDQEVDQWQKSPDLWPILPTGFQFSKNTVKRKKALILSPYNVGSDFLLGLPGAKSEVELATLRLKNAGFLIEYVSKVQELLTRNLGDYGVIFFASHGSIYSNGSFLDSTIASQSASTKAAAKSVLWMNEQVDLKSIFQYRSQILNLSLAIGSKGGTADFGLTPDFITKYSTQSNANSIVYLGTCFSMYNSSLSEAFQSIGAGAVLGYTDVVDDIWAKRHGIALVNALSTGRGINDLTFINNTQPGGRTQFKSFETNIDQNLALISNR